jgi:hypothetical protein
LLPDDEAIQQLKSSGEGFTAGHSVEDLAWPVEPLRTTLLRGLAKLGVSRLAQKYPAVQVRAVYLDALSSVLGRHVCRLSSASWLLCYESAWCMPRCTACGGY